MKDLYEKHINRIDNICDESLIDFFDNFHLEPATIKQLLLSLDSLLPPHMVKPIKDNLKHNVDLGIGINICYNSFVNYLYLLQCDKVNMSDIAFDDDTGSIAIFYSKDSLYLDSVKIHIQCKYNKYLFSVISRDGGLAKFSGEMSFKEDGFHKIENLLSMFE